MAATSESTAAAVQRLSAALEVEDPCIDELGLVMLGDGGADSDATEEPFVLAADGRKLGVNLAQVIALYAAALRLFREQQASGAHRMLLASTKVLLLLNADYESAWNARRTLLAAALATASDADAADVLHAERRFLDLVHTKHFKSAPSWAHRLWTLRLLLALSGRPGKAGGPGPGKAGGPSSRSADLEHELSVCQRVATSYRRCYNAWSHRTEVCGLLRRPQLLLERAAMRAWLHAHVSDHSAVCYLLRVQRCLGDPPRLLREDLAFAGYLAVKYPGHEALWLCKRALCFRLLAKTPTHELDVRTLRRRLGPWARTDELRPAEPAQSDLDSLAARSLEEVEVEMQKKIVFTEAKAKAEAKGEAKGESKEAAEVERSAVETLCEELAFAAACALDDACAGAAVQRRCALSLIVFVCRALALRLPPGGCGGGGGGGGGGAAMALLLRRLNSRFIMPGVARQATNEADVGAWAEAAGAALRVVLDASGAPCGAPCSPVP